MSTNLTKFVVTGIPVHNSQQYSKTEFVNFGQFEDPGALPITEIHLSNMFLDAELFTKKLNQLCTTEIQIIKLENISYKKIFQKVFLPSLSSFYFHSKTYQVENFQSTSIFFFQKFQNQEWCREEICNQGVSIDVKLESTHFFTIDHAQNYLFMGFNQRDTELILRNTQVTIQKLEVHIANPDESLDLSVIPLGVTYLELFVKHIPWTTIENFIYNCSNLVTFLYKPRQHLKKKLGEIYLSKLPQNLKQLTFFCCNFQIDPMLADSQTVPLDSLCLNRCSLIIGPIFLKTKKLLIMDCINSVKLSYETLDLFMNTPELDWICVNTSKLGEKQEIVDYSTNIAITTLKKCQISQIVYSSSSRMGHMNPNYALVFWRKPNSSEEWNVRTLFLEEWDFLTRKYLGVPISGEERCSSRDYEHEELTNKHAYFLYSSQKPANLISYTPLPPYFDIASMKRNHPKDIKYIWLDEVRIYNEDLHALADLDQLEAITLKNCICSHSLVNVESCDKKYFPRVFDGLDLNSLCSLKALKGISFIKTRIGSVLDTMEKPLDLNFLNLSDTRVPVDFDRRFNSKQLVIEKSVVEGYNLELIMRMTKLDTLFLTMYNWRTSSEHINEFLRKSGLIGWESNFILLRGNTFFKDPVTWRGFYVNKKLFPNLIKMAMKFEYIGNTFLSNLALCGEFDAQDASFHCEIGKILVCSDFEDDGNEYLNCDDTSSPSAPLDYYFSGEKNFCQNENFFQEKPKRVLGYGERENEYVDWKTSTFLHKGEYDYNTQEYSRFDGMELQCLQLPLSIIKFESVAIEHNCFIIRFDPSLITEIHLIDVDFHGNFILSYEIPTLQKLVVVLPHGKDEFSQKVLKNETNLCQFLLFFAPPEKQKLEYLWSLNVNISLSTGMDKYIEVDHDTKKVYLFKLSFLRSVLQNAVGIQILVLNSVADITLNQVDKSCMEILSFQDDGYYDWEEIEEFIQEMTKLREFYFYRRPFGKKMMVTLDKIPSSVKYLGLWEIALPPAPPVTPLHLQHLLLLRCSLSANLFKEFSRYFNARKLVVTTAAGGYDKAIPKIRPNHILLNSVVQETEVELIHISDFDRRLETEANEKGEIFLTNAMVRPLPPLDANVWYGHSASLTLQKNKNVWRKCEFEYKFTHSLETPKDIFENFCFGSIIDSTKLVNQIVYFEGFPPEMSKIRSIELRNVVINTELFRQELKRIGTETIEKISLHTVTFLCSSLKFCEIPFPNLKEFEYVGFENLGSMKSWEDLKHLLFFRKSYEKMNIKLKDLWNLGVNIRLRDQYTVYIEIDHVMKRLFVGIDEGNELLFNTTDVAILEFISDSEQPNIFPTSLRKLKIDCPMSWSELESSISSYENLEELSYKSKEWDSNKVLATIQKLPPNLLILNMCNVAVTFNLNFQLKKLQSVSFDSCTFTDGNISTNFSKLIDAEEVYFSGYSNPNFPHAELIYNLMKMERIRILVTSNYNRSPKLNSRFTEKMLDDLNKVLDETKGTASSFTTSKLSIIKDPETGTWRKYNERQVNDD